MTHRERANLALSHKEPDYVPVDVGGTHDTTCLLGSYLKLREHLGTNGSPTPAHRWLGSVYLDEEMLSKLDVDFRPLAFPTPDYAETVHADGTVTFDDEWGIRWKKPQGGLYFDVASFREIDSLEQVEKGIKWPTIDSRESGWLKSLDVLKNKAVDLRNNTNYATILDFGVAPFTMVQLLHDVKRTL